MKQSNLLTVETTPKKKAAGKQLHGDQSNPITPFIKEPSKQLSERDAQEQNEQQEQLSRHKLERQLDVCKL